MSGHIHSAIKFHYLFKSFFFPRRGLLKAFIEGMLKKHHKSIGSVDYIFCSDEYLLEINRKQLDHDFYTEIITFNLSSLEEPLIAEIYISIDRVAENAKTFQSTFYDELHRVIFHGVLHLNGHKDKSKKEATAMRRAEDNALSAYLKFHVKRTL